MQQQLFTEETSEPLYSVGTWDSDLGAFTPQVGMEKPWLNVSKWQLKAALKELKTMDYGCYRLRGEDGEYDDSDPAVWVERSDGKSEAEVTKGFRR